MASGGDDGGGGGGEVVVPASSHPWKTKANHSGFCPGIHVLAYSNAISLL